MEITRNGHNVPTLAPGTPRMTALEAFSDIYRILSSAKGEDRMRGMDLGRKGRFTDPWTRRFRG